MTVPYFFRDEVDKACAFVDRTLPAGLTTKKTVDAAHAKAGYILGWRNDSVFYVLVGIEAGGGHVIAELHSLMTLLERHCKGESLPVLRIPIVFMLIRQHHRIAVLIENRQNFDRLLVAAHASSHRERDWHDLLRYIEFAVDHLVSDESDARNLL